MLLIVELSQKIASIEGNSDDALVERKMCELFIETANLKEAVIDGKERIGMLQNPQSKLERIFRIRSMFP
jgi:hypothetical protein